MNDEMKVRETLSALLDDEASELDLHRLSKQPISADVLARMRRYQAVRATLAGQRAVATLDVSARVSELLRQEPVPVAEPEHLNPSFGNEASFGNNETAPDAMPQGGERRTVTTAPRARRQLIGGIAVAASVALAVVFSVQTTRDLPDESTPRMAQSPMPQSAIPAYVQPLPGEAHPSAWQPDHPAALASTPMAPARGLDMNEEHQRRLNNYLLRHAEQAARANGQSMVPYARLTGYEAAGARPSK